MSQCSELRFLKIKANNLGPVHRVTYDKDRLYLLEYETVPSGPRNKLKFGTVTSWKYALLAFAKYRSGSLKINKIFC